MSAKFQLQRVKCNKKNKSHKGLAYHIERCLTNTKPKNPCPKCGKDFKNPTSLKNHTRNCGREPKWLCKFCTYKTRFSNNLKKHLHIHHSKSTNAQSNGGMSQEIGTKSKNMHFFMCYIYSKETLLL